MRRRDLNPGDFFVYLELPPRRFETPLTQLRWVPDEHGHPLVEHDVAVPSPDFRGEDGHVFLPADVLDCQVAKVEVGKLPALWTEKEGY